MLPPSTLRPERALGLHEGHRFGVGLALLQLLHKVVRHFFELGLVDGEESFKLLDLFEQVFRHIGHRPCGLYELPVVDVRQGDTVPFRDGFRRGGKSTMLAVPNI